MVGENADFDISDKKNFLKNCRRNKWTSTGCNNFTGKRIPLLEYSFYVEAGCYQNHLEIR